jgi:uncharacterized membrane protein
MAKQRADGIIVAMLFAPFLFIYVIIFFFALAVLFVLAEINIISYVFTAIGLPPGLAFLALLVSLLGSYVNIPVGRIERGEVHHAEIVSSFGVRYRVPVHLGGGSTVVAVNLGGAIVPVVISIYVIIHQLSVLLPALIGTAIVAVVVHQFARPVKGLGIATPMLIPPVVAAVVAMLLMGGLRHHADAVAYISGVLGTLIGADLWNLGKIRDLGAPVASIGGAGTFDGIFLTGIVAVLLA